MSDADKTIAKCRCYTCHFSTSPVFGKTQRNNCIVCNASMYCFDVIANANHCKPVKTCKHCKQNEICFRCYSLGINFCALCISAGFTGNEKVIMMFTSTSQYAAENSLPKPGTGYAEFCRIHASYGIHVDASWTAAPNSIREAFEALAAAKKQ